MADRNKNIEEFERSLLKFVKRASGKNATAEEVGTLPKVAWVLMKLWNLDV